MNIRLGAGAVVVVFCLLVYLPVCLSTYAFSDDYSMLIWLRQDELKKKVDFALSNGRPLLIAAQCVAFKLARDVQGLWPLRALSIAGAIGFGLLFMRLLRAHGHLHGLHALLLTLLALCLPASQISIAWAGHFAAWWAAIFSTLAVHVLLAPGTRFSGGKRLALLMLLQLLALMTYQPNAMMFFALLAVVLLCRSADASVRSADAPKSPPAWRTYAIGIAAAFVSMVVAYLLIRLYPVQTSRAGFETDWPDKLLYWASHSLLLSFSLFRLQPHAVLGLLNAAVAVGLLIFCLVRRRLPAWGAMLVVLAIPLAHLPSLVTQANMAPRRTLLPLSLLALVACYLGYVQLVRHGLPRWVRERATPARVTFAGAAIALIFGIAAQAHVLKRIIRPQQREFDAVKVAIRDQQIAGGDRVYVIQSHADGYFMQPDDMLEFGSPTNVHYWALPSMVHLAAEEVWSPRPERNKRWLDVRYGYEPPPPESPHQKVIDMSQLRVERERRH